MPKIAYLMSQILNRVGFFRKVRVKNAHLEKNLDHRVGMQRMSKKKSPNLGRQKQSKGG